mgnify:CR=1 FL=1
MSKPSVISIPEVKSLKMTMNAMSYKTLVAFLLSQLEGEKLAVEEDDYLRFKAQVIAILKQNAHEPKMVIEARKLALTIHRFSRSVTDETTRYPYRMLGHSVATIHVRTHAFGYIYYALRYVQATQPNKLKEAVELYCHTIAQFGGNLYA